MSSETVPQEIKQTYKLHKVGREALVVASLHKEVSMYYLTVKDIDQMSWSISRILSEHGYVLVRVEDNKEGVDNG